MVVVFKTELIFFVEVSESEIGRGELLAQLRELKFEFDAFFLLVHALLDHELLRLFGLLDKLLLEFGELFFPADEGINVRDYFALF